MWVCVSYLSTNVQVEILIHALVQDTVRCTVHGVHDNRIYQLLSRVN